MTTMKLTAAACLMSMCINANAQTLWDGFIPAPAIKSNSPGWLTCVLGEEFSPSDEAMCVKPGGVLLPDTPGTPPSIKSLQEMLEARTKAPAGYRLVAIGPLPFAYFQRGSGVGGSTHAYLNVKKIYIAYRLMKIE